MLLQLSLYKPERLARVVEKGAVTGQAAVPEDASEDLPPKRLMSRSGSSRLLSSFGELTVAERAARPSKGAAPVDVLRIEELGNSASPCELPVLPQQAEGALSAPLP